MSAYLTNPVFLCKVELNAWHHYAASDFVDIYAADLAAALARTSQPACVALVRGEKLPSICGLAAYLYGYGILLKPKARTKRDGYYIYAEFMHAAENSDFEGATVRALPAKKAIKA